MAKIQAWSCSSCSYWQPYPDWEGVGTCDNVVSRSYGRMSMGRGDACENYAGAGPAVCDLGVAKDHGGPRSGETTCGYCNYWFPSAMMARIGECDNPSSGHFGSAEFQDKQGEGCFLAKALEGLELMWCQTHGQVISSEDLAVHGRCRLYARCATIPVEEEMELTLAGD